MASLIVTVPAALALPASALRGHCRVDHDGEDGIIEDFIAAAQRQAEEVSGRAIGETAYQLRLNRFPVGAEPILLPRPRAVTIDAVEYLAADGTLTDLPAESRQDDIYGEPARIYPACESQWPATQAGAINAVVISFTAGSDLIDPMVLQAIRLAVADWYEHRENTVEKTVSRLPNGFDRLLGGVRFRSRELQRFLDSH
jgi:uncharacterized phiE125 gp8 family phage protein